MDSAGRDADAEGDGSSGRGERSSGDRCEQPACVTCQPESYRAAKLSVAAYLLCWALLRWYQKLRWRSATLLPQEALEDSPHVTDRLGLNEGDFFVSPPALRKRSKRGVNIADTSFDSCSWHSDSLSDLNSDGEDCLDALLGQGSACDGLRATSSNVCTVQRKARRRESVTAKGKDVTETYARHSSCSRKTIPQHHLDPKLPLKQTTSDLGSVEIQPCLSTEKLNLNSNKEQSGLQAVNTETQVNASTEPYSLHVQSQQNTDTFDTKVEQCGCVGTTTKGTKPPGTVNEIHSSITFSTETTASVPLDTSATELTVAQKVSNPASFVSLTDSDRAEFTGRQLDQHFPSKGDNVVKLKAETFLEDNRVEENEEFNCSRSGRSESLKTLGVGLDCDFEEEHERDYCLSSRKRESLSESLREYTLAEEYRNFTLVSLPTLQQEVKTVRYSHADVSLNRLAVRNLEPIQEAEGSLESCSTTDSLIIERNKDYEIMRPAEEVSDIVNLSGDSSSPKRPHQQTEQNEKPLATAEVEPDLSTVTPILGSGIEKQCGSLTVAYDAVSYTSASSNCNELEDPHFDISDRNSNLDKEMKRNKTKGNQTGNKGSKFSVFAKMPSFRRSKGSKGSKSEDVLPESPDRGSDWFLFEQGQQKDNSDDEVFVKSDIHKQIVQQTVHNEIEEDCDFFHPSPHTCHARHLGSEGSSEVGSRGSSSDSSLVRSAHSPNSQTYKRSKSNDSLKIPWKKSLSSLFESRSVDKENEDQATLGSEVDSGKVKQSWRKLKKTKEAELLKRTLSVPVGENTNMASEQDCGDFLFSPVMDRLSNAGSPYSIRGLHHTDPMPKRGVPQESSCLHQCKSEGQRRKATLAHQHSPSWTRSQPMASDGLTESPLRPMSPKPNSPRPASQRKIFRYPHSSRTSSVCSIHLGQSVSTEGLTDPPKRPKTLKPSSSPLGVSLSPLDAAEGRKDSQSHISLYAIGFINELEGTQNGGRPASQSTTQKLLKGELKTSVVFGGLRTGCLVDVGCDGSAQQQRRRCLDDLWIEEQKKYKCKLARAIRGSLGQLNILISEELDKTDVGVTLGSVRVFRGMPLKAHCFSQSTPIGLDCLGWRRSSTLWLWSLHPLYVSDSPVSKDMPAYALTVRACQAADYTLPHTKKINIHYLPLIQSLKKRSVFERVETVWGGGLKEGRGVAILSLHLNGILHH
ncbi:hypothetical protein Q5P01_003911 [Channa striata]|uniref:Uncharacterized protein n=1 Tax=Channa striata TaxID=64152 RepID=A0AA88T559_CHASR|nr:hypothetical protein Q5P01_003911 [Channa striata]